MNNLGKLLLVISLLMTGINVKGQALKKGDIVIDAYAGYPNWGQFFTESHIKNNDVFEGQTKGGIVPLGLKSLFMIDDIFSFTLDINYTSWGGDWASKDSFQVYNENDGSYQNIMANYDFSVQRLRFQVGINYHMDDMEIEELDLYGGLAIGTNTIFVQEETNDPYFDFRTQSYFLDDPLLLTPISVRARIGARYFIRDNFALNLELGLGGPTIAAGLSFRL